MITLPGVTPVSAKSDHLIQACFYRRTVNGFSLLFAAKDLTKFSLRQIHDFLAKEQMLPALRRPGSRNALA